MTVLRGSVFVSCLVLLLLPMEAIHLTVPFELVCRSNSTFQFSVSLWETKKTRHGQEDDLLDKKRDERIEIYEGEFKVDAGTVRPLGTIREFYLKVRHNCVQDDWVTFMLVLPECDQWDCHFQTQSFFLN